MSTLNIQLLYRRSKRFPLIIHHLLPDLAPGLTLNYPYLEQIFLVQKRFKPSKFDCNMCLNGKKSLMIKAVCSSMVFQILRINMLSFFSLKYLYFSSFSRETYVVGTH